MAIQLFISLIEFNLTTLAGFVLVPFGLFGRTAFLAEKVLGNVVSSGVKIWDERIGSARVQAQNWRLAFFGMLTLSAGAAGLVWQSARGTVTPWVVEVDKLGQAQAVAPAVAGYRELAASVWFLASA